MDPERSQEATEPSSGSSPTPAAPAQADATDVAATAPSSVLGGRKPRRTRPNAGTHPNNVKKLRQRAMMSKAELARRAQVSPLTIDRVEAGCPCRMDTKRKILEALGLSPSGALEVFPDVDLG